MADCMDQPWCCLACFAKFTFGDLVTNKPGPGLVFCPKCGTANVHPIDGVEREVPEYVGPIGSIN